MKGTGGFLNPDKIVNEFGIEQGMKIADFGCGAGYFTIAMARVVGEEGKVYAFDIVRTALEAVVSKSKVESLLNIQTSWSNLEVPNGSNLEDESVDMVLLANILFQSSRKNDIIKEAKRILKKGGKMMVIDWQKNQTMGPPEKLIVSKDSVKKMVKKEGFKSEKEFFAGINHWGMIFAK